MLNYNVQDYIKAKHSHPEEGDSNFAFIQKFNKELIAKYPWLMPRNRWSDEVVEDYDYTWTELDALPDGWYLKFGLDICEEIQEVLEKINCVDSYRILQVKEKYGSLRWYSNGTNEEIENIISKYEKLSEEICICCGEPAKWESGGWINYFCDDCANEFYQERYPKREYPFEEIFFPIEKDNGYKTISLDELKELLQEEYSK